MINQENLNTIIRHIKRVEDNCNVLARKLMNEDPKIGLKLIQLGRIHDVSKLDSFEFDYLHKESKWFKEALGEHWRKNPHHPEYWPCGIYTMDDVYIAEMVCDCHARGQEFGTDTRKWFHEEATKKYGFSMDDRVGQLITKYLDLLLSPAFK